MAKRGLGRGLQALIPAETLPVDSNTVLEIAVNHIEPNTYQPRKNFNDESLDELALSIQEHGVVQPVVLRQLADDRYELVTGERRWRACRKLGLKTIPAVVKEFNDQQITEIALIENIQREDLSPLEEAAAYRTLVDEFNITQDDLAKKVGKSRPHIANMLRLLKLPPEIQSLIEEQKLTAGHGRALLGISVEQQMEIAKLIFENDYNVRQTEKLVKDLQKNQESKEQRKVNIARKDPIILEIQDKFTEFFGTKVQLKTKEDQSGRIEIEYYSIDDLNRILDLIGGIN